ncbi:MAG: type II toxin-antitoxin system VapC family toxin [Spirochaetia bacterium]|jgi:predicted nucleic acid-binding protein
MKFVIDASVAARWYILEESNANAEEVLQRVVMEPELFAVPELFFFEVLAVLGRTHPHPLETYKDAFLPVVEGGVFRHPMTASLAERSYRFLTRGLTGYDACYAGLAEELGARWITFDHRAHQCIASEKVSVDLGEGLPADW